MRTRHLAYRIPRNPRRRRGALRPHCLPDSRGPVSRCCPTPATCLSLLKVSNQLPRQWLRGRSPPRVHAADEHRHNKRDDAYNLHKQAFTADNSRNVLTVRSVHLVHCSDIYINTRAGPPPRLLGRRSTTFLQKRRFSTSSINSTHTLSSCMATFVRTIRDVIRPQALGPNHPN